MAAVLNPFVWDRPLDDPAKIVGMEPFAHQVALTLKGQTNVALFGPRDTGKTTFTNQLALELAKEHGPDAPPFDVSRSTCSAWSVSRLHRLHPRRDGRSPREARAPGRSASDRGAGEGDRVRHQGDQGHGALGAAHARAETPRRCTRNCSTLRSLSDHLVVIFDEFQRLRHCAGDPLAIIRSALMSSGANHVSLLFTGSIRNALQMMLESSEQPIFGEAADMQLPAIGRADFLEYLDFQFEATGKPADEDALELPAGRHPGPPPQHPADGLGMLDQTPRRRAGHPRDGDRAPTTGWCRRSSGRSSASVLDVLINGDEGEVNEVRALQLLADRGGDDRHQPAARDALRLLEPLPSAPALERLQPAGPGGQARRRLVHRRPAVRRVAAASLAACGCLLVPLPDTILYRVAVLSDAISGRRPGRLRT